MAKLLSSLPVGAKVKDVGSRYNNKDIIFTIAAKKHSGYPTNSVTLITERIISLKCFDAKEANNPDSNRKSYGNNRYLHSNIRQWLNSDKVSWYTSQHSYDAPPTDANVWSNYNEYDQEKGLLAYLTDNFKNAILPTTLKVVKNTVTDGGGYETVTDKVFLPSKFEVGLGTENGIEEGDIFPLFINDESRKAYPTAEAVANSEYTNSGLSSTKPWYYWLRSPYSGNSYVSRYVYSSGGLSNNVAYYGNYGVRPALNLKSEIFVSDSMDSDGCYIIQWNNSPTISGSDQNLGDKNTSFEIRYQIDDVDTSDTLTIKEKIDGTEIKAISPAQRKKEYIINIDTYSLSLGTHIVTIEVTDNKGGIAKRSYTFKRVNAAPTISGSDQNIGDKNQGFQIIYNVDDPDSDALTVTEKINGSIIRTLNNAPRNEELTILITNEQLYSLPLNSSNTITIEAKDPNGGVAYRTFTFRRTNTAPSISGTDDELGVIMAPFSREYVVTDVENDTVVVKELIDNKVVRTYVPELGATNKFEMPIEEWHKLTNGNHIVKIEATDTNGATSVRIFQFERKEDKIKFTLKNPFETDIKATKVLVTPSWVLPEGSIPKIEACNNAYDDVPTWEDITSQVTQGRHYNFLNEAKSADKWGINIRVTVTL